MIQKRSIIKGAFILTIAGFISRFIGFFYRIFLSNSLGAEGMGIYQLIFPIYTICFTLYSAGIQTAISKLVAEELGRGNVRNVRRILRIGIIISFGIALTLSILLNINAEFVARNVLLETRCASSLKILSYVFPFCGITSCINGYYYGLKKANIPASTQLLEQLVRVGAVYLILYLFKGHDMVELTNIAVVGIVIGEILSNIYNIGSLYICKFNDLNSLKSNTYSYGKISKKIISIALPLTSNRLLLNVLQSFESVLISAMLKEYGLSSQEALSTYGILVGMAMPFIMFPSAITNSLAVMLLPTVSEAQASNNSILISKTTNITIKYSLIIGILSTGLFILFGRPLGLTVFNDELAGSFLITLAWLCPFMYLTTTLGSILNGLGKTNITFLHSLISLLIRLFFIIYFIPKFGISGYLWGLLISQLVVSLLDIIATKKNIRLNIDSYNWILKPSLILCFVGFFALHFYTYLNSLNFMNSILLLLVTCFALCVIYVALLYLMKIISKKDLY